MQNFIAITILQIHVYKHNRNSNPRQLYCFCRTFRLEFAAFDPLLGVSWWFRDAGSAHSVHGPAFELSTRQLERSGFWQGQLQTFTEDASIFTVLKHLAC